MGDEDDEKDPLEYLSEKENEVMSGVLSIIEAVIEDDELRNTLVGTILVEVQEWGVKKSKPN
jgi:hypothetical protein